MEIRILGALIIVAVALTGCKAHMSTLNQSQENQFLFPLENEKQALELIYETLLELKPDSLINEIPGPNKGYSAYWTILLDRYLTTARIMYGKGKDINGNEVIGFYPDVSGRGTMVYAGPVFSTVLYDELINRFEKVSKKIKITKLHGVRHSTAFTSKNKGPSSGSGFFINNNGDVLTNNHVTDGCKKINVVHNGMSKLSSLIGKDGANDLAVLRTHFKNNNIIQLRHSSSLNLAEQVMVLGYPLRGILSEQMHATSGDVTALAGLRGDSRFFQTSAPIQSGNSGGPILDDSGALVGVATSKLNAIRVARVTGDIPQNVNFGIKSAVVFNFLDSLNINYKKSKQTVILNKQDIVKKTKDAVVSILCD
jgi:S1-C subfamily serine protease